MLQLLRLLSTSTDPLNRAEIFNAGGSLRFLEIAIKDGFVFAKKDFLHIHSLTEAGRARLAELEAEERVIEALAGGPLNFPTFFARLGDSNAVGVAADRLEKAGKVVIERSCNGTISGLRLATSEALANSATVDEARTAGVYVEVSDDSPLEEVRALLSRVSDLEGDCGMLREDLEEANKELAAEKARNEATEEWLRAAEANARKGWAQWEELRDQNVVLNAALQKAEEERQRLRARVETLDKALAAQVARNEAQVERLRKAENEIGGYEMILAGWKRIKSP